LSIASRGDGRTTKEQTVSIENLLKTNVNEHTERKQNLTYLSWAWAWAEALKADPKVTYKVEMFGDKCFMDINGTAMVWVTVTIFDKPMTCQLPVMDHRNKAIPNPDAFAVNTAIMRCMTKALSLHGLGLYIYAGEDLPEAEAPQKLDLQAAQTDVAAAKTVDELGKVWATHGAIATAAKDRDGYASLKALCADRKAALEAA
jgi:hypothetical protein